MATEDRRAAVAKMKELREAQRKARAEQEERNRQVARAWDAWVAGEEGEACLQEDGCYGEYLRNRLWRAFMAGAASVPSGGVDG